MFQKISNNNIKTNKNTIKPTYPQAVKTQKYPIPPIPQQQNMDLAVMPKIFNPHPYSWKQPNKINIPQNNIIIIWIQLSVIKIRYDRCNDENINISKCCLMGHY